MTAPLALQIRQLVAEDLAGADGVHLHGEDRKEFARQRVYRHLDALSADASTPGFTPPSAEQELALAQSVLDALFGLGRLQTLIDDPDIENVDINGHDRVWATFADGTKELMEPVADSDGELIDMLRSAAARFGLSERRFDLASPELDLQLPDGSRLSALMAVSARPAVSIRRHRYADLSLDDLQTLGTVDEGLRSFLSTAVRAGKNIVVAGAMNSGKTTLLRALAAEIAQRERIVTIEQAFELGLDTGSMRHPDMVALEARAPNVEGEGRISVADLVRRALRMNADRVIVGEVLGDEVLPMLNAMSQGRSGSMCTIHADSSAGAFRRIASYAVQAPERLPLEATNLLIAGALHFVVHLETAADDGEEEHVDGVLCDRDLGDGIAGGRHFPVRFPACASRVRFVSSVREVVDAEGVQVISNEIYRPGPDRRAVPASPLRTETLDDLIQCGFTPAFDRRSESLR